VKETTVKRLEGRVALITGGASGIGRATARRLASEGAAVVVSDIQDDAGKLVVDGMHELGEKAIYVHHDVSSPEDWNGAVGAALQEFGGLDILVNNAGIGDLGTIEETSYEDYQKTIRITQDSVFLGMKSAAEALKESPHASVINISSIFGMSGGFGSSPAYHAAKGAVRLITKNAALHWAGEGIRVNSIHPGFIDTPILEQTKGTEFEAAMIAMTPMARLGHPEEIAAAVAYLASDDASFVTGSELVVDGGYLAR
jgi:NAD(P)-dependent dehydrogenase (short-subunit alcohol dehydrogenase family)